MEKKKYFVPEINVLTLMEKFALCQTSGEIENMNIADEYLW
jgi:hypothetical protein